MTLFQNAGALGFGQSFHQARFLTHPPVHHPIIECQQLERGDLHRITDTRGIQIRCTPTTMFGITVERPGVLQQREVDATIQSKGAEPVKISFGLT